MQVVKGLIIMKTIDVLVSTFGERIHNLENILLQQQDNVHYLIGHQGESSSLPQCLGRSDVTYYKVVGFGVTKSRNKLIDNSSADIVYFCDDDVKLSCDIFNVLLETHLEDTSDVITYCISDEFGKLRKPYSSVKCNRTFKNILSIGTIEISVKRKSIGSIRFPEDMGAGSLIPCGDEAVFLADFLKEEKKIVFYPYVVAEHEKESSGVDISKEVIFSRGVTIRRVFGIKGILILIPFFIVRQKLFGLKSQFFIKFFHFCRGFFVNK
jgi:glycosyltransferase involved in cell wall biosynthesis